MINLDTGLLLQPIDLINSQSYAFIKDFGLPTFLVLILLTFLFWISRRDDKRQLKAEARYEELVNRFISDFKDISNEHKITIDKIVERHASSIETLSDEHEASIDKLIREIRPIVEQLILIAERLEKHDYKSDKVLEYIYEYEKKLRDDREKYEMEKDIYEQTSSKQRSITARRG